MEEFFLALLSFIFIYILYLIIVVGRKKSLERLDKTTEYMYLKKRYKLKLEKVNKKSLANLIALANSFIIALTVFIVSIVENIALKILLALLVMIPFILIIYHFIGIYLKKKERK